MTAQQALAQLVGAQYVLTGADASTYETDWRGRYAGHALAVVRPANTDEVAQVVRWCAEHAVPIVPQGGNTGLCAGATPDDSATAVILSLGRLNRVRTIDTDNDTMVVEAGCILQDVQQAAFQAGRLFPLSLAAEGSCTIGGNLATNAGGTQVVRYGNARDLTLGLEVVTSDGRIVHGLRGLRKDNTGYDLRNLFIGSEGTLGIITAACVKLFAQPAAQCTALLAFSSVEDAVVVLSATRQGFGAALTGFELMASNSLQRVVQCFPQQRLPFAQSYPWYALLELSDSESAEHARERLETVFDALLQEGTVTDVVIAENIAQSKALWHLRESIPMAERELGKGVKHDVSIPISRMSDFVRTTGTALETRFPGIEQIVFGHLGDGNLHYNVVGGTALDETQLMAAQDTIYTIVHDQVHQFDGSISAEHGIGQLKRDILPRYKDAVSLALMRDIKRALDPHNILNPGKVLQV